MFIPTISRRSAILVGALSFLLVIAVLHAGVRSPPAYLSWSSPASSADATPFAHEDKAIRHRLGRLVDMCATDDPFELEYGRTNLRLSRSYEGSQQRVRGLLHKILRGEKFTISAIGGSVTQGHAVYSNEAWFYRFGAWMQDFVGSDNPITHVNGGAPATGSDYFSFCFPLHIPRDSDLILVELGVNDQGIPEHVENMENLLRGLLDLPHKPAVILVEAAAFDSGGMGGGGGRMHLPVAQYYDVPVISQRHVMAAHLERYPQLLRHYFASDWWGNPDRRHINSRGHRDLAMLVASFIRDSACTMIHEPDFVIPDEAQSYAPQYGVPAYIEQASAAVPEEDNADEVEIASLQDALVSSYEEGWPRQARAWRQGPEEGQTIGELVPGMWMNPLEYGQIPRLRLLQGWDEDLSHFAPPFHPMCMSTRSKDPAFNLTPSATDGWEHWVHPDYKDKPYLLAKTPGAMVTFQLETVVGIVKMYSLKSKTFGLGTVECWADDDKSQSVKIEGYWDNGNANIGRFDTIRTDLSPGSHAISCQLLEETADPGGGHEFRMISIMRSFIHMHATYIPVRSSLAVDQAPRKMPVGDGRLPLFWSLIGVIFSLLFFDLDEPVLGVNAARAVRKAHCAANTILAVIPARSAHGISIMQVSARKTTSTILDGNHAVPPLYVCYLLRSRATPDSRLTYIGSTPNPPKRLRQHNRDLTQGAKKTSRHGPWEMQMMVYGFPSKLTALQFEWAWQKHDMTRHLRLQDAAETPILKNMKPKGTMETKILAARMLLSVPPFSQLPLHLRFYNHHAQNIYDKHRQRTVLDLGNKRNPCPIPLHPVPPEVTSILDLGGVSGQTGLRIPDTPGVTTIDGPIDVNDTDFRESQRIWGKWQQLSSEDEPCRCDICTSEIDKHDHLSYALCVADTGCTSTSHLACLAQNRARAAILLPKTVSCPDCRRPHPWGEIVRACYARRDGVAKEAEQAAKRARKKMGVSSDTDMSSLSQDSNFSLPSDTPGTSRTRPKRPKRKTKKERTDKRQAKSQPDGDSDGQSSEEEWVRFEREMMAMS